MPIIWVTDPRLSTCGCHTRQPMRIPCACSLDRVAPCKRICPTVFGMSKIMSGRKAKSFTHGIRESAQLWCLVGKQIARTLFPVGELPKPEVRRIAAEQGFINHAKKDSTGICFIGERRFRDFLSQYLPAQAGEIVTDEGKVIGEHLGLMYYTFGQRQGIGIGGVKNSAEAPWFVVDKDLAHKKLIIGQGHEHPLLMSRSLFTQNMDWVAGTAPEMPLRCTAKTRYRQPDQDCVATIEGDGLSVTF